MERFKAVEKEMKTKAYSKEGLSAAAKLDPKEKEKVETCQFLSSMVEELERQVETLEAEAEGLQANLKKGRKDNHKADRVAEIERITDRHKWHQAKLELILRSLENGGLETEQVLDLQEDIKYYVESSQEDDFIEDDEMYNKLHLEEEEDIYGMAADADRVSSQDAQSIQDDVQDGESKGPPGKGKATEASGAAARRPSTQIRSPLPALATLHTPLANTTNGTSNAHMKPAAPPSRPAGETLKYASAAAAAAAGDKAGVGIAPLPPPPPGSTPLATAAPPGLAPLPPSGATRAGAQTPPPSEPAQTLETAAKGPPAAAQQPTAHKALAAPTAAARQHERAEIARPTPSKGLPPKPVFDHKAAATESHHESPMQEQRPDLDQPQSSSSHTQPAPPPIPTSASQAHALVHNNSTGSSDISSTSNFLPSGKAVQAPSEAIKSTAKPTATAAAATAQEAVEANEATESIYHLPPGLQDLLQSFEVTKSRMPQNASPSAGTTNATTRRLLAASHATRPDSIDADRPRPYRAERKFNSPTYYPQEPLPLFEDARLYARADTDTLFFTFYYRQGSFQQYLAAKALKSQSWRFHKQYQTWFQRHEEPKTITEEYEQGTYRFFDYESTWWVFVWFFFWFSLLFCRCVVCCLSCIRF